MAADLDPTEARRRRAGDRDAGSGRGPLPGRVEQHVPRLGPGLVPAAARRARPDRALRAGDRVDLQQGVRAAVPASCAAAEPEGEPARPARVRRGPWSRSPATRSWWSAWPRTRRRRATSRASGHCVAELKIGGGTATCSATGCARCATGCCARWRLHLGRRAPVRYLDDRAAAGGRARPRLVADKEAFAVAEKASQGRRLRPWRETVAAAAADRPLRDRLRVVLQLALRAGVPLMCRGFASRRSTCPLDEAFEFARAVSPLAAAARRPASG